MNTRALAARILVPVFANQSPLNFEHGPIKKARSSEDAGLIKRLCFETCRHTGALQRLRKKLLKQPLRTEHADIQALVDIGLCELAFLGTPDHAAIHQAVEAAKQLKKPWAAKLINAVLRRFTRERDALLAPIESLSVAQRWYPDWWVQRVTQDWGDKANAILTAGNDHPPMHLRIQSQRIRWEEYSAQLTAAGLSHAPYSPDFPQAITLAQPVAVHKLPGFSDGLVSVQDLHAQLAIHWLPTTAPADVLDACAAPGGKTALWLEQDPALSLTAVDKAPDKLPRIEETLSRLGLRATVKAADAASWAPGKTFDAILCDAPCSASGIVRRHPEIRWQRQPADLAGLVKQQTALLNHLWGLLKPGGVLLYATCSIFAAENAQQIETFLATHSDASINNPPVANAVDTGQGLQFFPTPDGGDGFFYAALTKSASSPA